MRIIHFTSEKNLKRINKKGYLEPKTELYDKSDEKNGFVTKINQDKYIGGIPDNRLNDWEKHPELWNILNKHTKREVKVTFDLFNLKGVLVREHNYLTNEYSNSIYCQRVLPGFGQMSLMEWQIRDLMRQYVQSFIPLKDVQLDNIRVPEIWIPYKIQRDQLEIGRIEKKREPLFQKILYMINPKLILSGGKNGRINY